MNCHYHVGVADRLDELAANVVRPYGEAAEQRGRRDSKKAGNGFELGLVRRRLTGLAASAIARLVKLKIAQEEDGRQDADHVQKRNAEDPC